MSDKHRTSSLPAVSGPSPRRPGAGDPPLQAAAASSPEWTRRNFIYGSAAAAAGAVMFRDIGRPGGRGVPGRHPGRMVPAQSSGGFTHVQTGPQVHNTASLPLTLDAASSPGSLVVATMLNTAGDQPFSGPSEWQLAGAVALEPETGQTTSPGRVEIWYFLNPPGGSTTIGSATFTSTRGDCRGCLAEFAPPSGATVILDARGQGATTENGALQQSFGISAASSNAVGDLGIVVAGDFFGSNTGGGWVDPAGYTSLRLMNGVADNFGSWYNPGLSGTAPQSPSATYKYAGSPTQTGWAMLFAAFRAVSFQPIYLTGGEMATMAALDPTGQQLIMGGDVEGLWRSADFGDTWQPTQNGLYSVNWRDTACVAWSELEDTTVYACVGEDTVASPSTGGGFLASTDGGLTWSPRSAAVQFDGNDVDAGLRPPGASPAEDRSTGHLLAQDSQGAGYLYTATYNGGIARSSASYTTPESPPGTFWQNAGLNENPVPGKVNPFFPRAIAINPSNPEELWVGLWNYDDTSVSPNVTYGGIYHCTDARTAGSNADWTLLTSAPFPKGTVSDLKVIDGYLYVAYTDNGMYVCELSSGTWTSLNAGPITVNNSQTWTSIDGYVSATSPDPVHVIVAGSSSGTKPASGATYQNIVKITVIYGSGAPSVTATDLTISAAINTQTMPPYGQEWWLATAHYQDWLGGKFFFNPHILINPANPDVIFVVGASGFYRYSQTAPGAFTWQLCGTGVPMSAISMIAVDPGNSQHIILASADHIQTDLTDPTAWKTSGVTPVGMPNPFSGVAGYVGNESHAVAFDAASNVFTGMNEKYAQNMGGTVYWRPAGSFTWYDTGYNGALSGTPGTADVTVAAPTGLFATSDAMFTYLTVVTAGRGAWVAKALSATLLSDPSGVSWTWTTEPVSTTIGSKGNIGLHCPIVVNPNNTADFFVYDRKQGIFRVTDHGNGDWSLIWRFPAGTSVTSARSGWLAANPNPPSGQDAELWVTTSTTVYQVDIAQGVVTSSNDIGGSNFPYGAAGIAVTSAGDFYALAIAGENQPDVQLLAYPAGGSGWVVADDSGSVGSYVSWPTSITVSQNPHSTPAGAEMLMIASDDNWAMFGIPTA